MESSHVVERGCLLWPVYPLGKILLAFALLHFVLQGHTCLLLQVFLDFLLLHFNPLWWKGCLFFVLVLAGLVGLHRTITFSFFSISGWGIDLDYCGVEWFALKMNWYLSVVFEIAPKYCISILSAPNPAPGHRQPIPMLETPGPSRASLGQTPLGHCSFLLGRGSGSCGGRNNKINSYLLSVCYVQATFKSFICINNVILLIVLLGGPYY